MNMNNVATCAVSVLPLFHFSPLFSYFCPTFSIFSFLLLSYFFIRVCWTACHYKLLSLHSDIPSSGYALPREGNKLNTSASLFWICWILNPSLKYSGIDPASDTYDVTRLSYVPLSGLHNDCFQTTSGFILWHRQVYWQDEFCVWSRQNQRGRRVWEL